MSIYQIGMDSKMESGIINIQIKEKHPLLQIGNALPWQRMASLVVPDLRKTGKGCWWLGRKLFLRIHLAVFILQSRFQMTDRETEEQLKYNGLYQVFCGKEVVGKWHVPDHTAIVRFRNRLTPETQRQLLLMVVKTAEILGFADPTWMDIDSTVQEANIAYPSDASLMLKLSKMGQKVLDYLRKKTKGVVPLDFQFNLENISKKSKEYFFLAKNTAIEKRRKIFKEFHHCVKKELYQVIDILTAMDRRRLTNMPWNIRQSTEKILKDGKRYLLDVAHFIRTTSIKSGKILSFHSKEVACIVKGKLGKDHEFGRIFQLGRIGGNFLFPLAGNSVRLEDKKSVTLFLEEHAALFGEDVLDSLGSDKGYYSKKNVKSAFDAGVKEVGIQCAKNVRLLGQPDLSLAKKLRDRRAGIEPLIGHVKKMGLAKSRMKTDSTTLASGYRSILGFNLRQLERHQVEKMKMLN